MNNRQNGLEHKLESMVDPNGRCPTMVRLFTKQFETNTVRLSALTKTVFIHNRTMYDLARYYAGLKYIVRYFKDDPSFMDNVHEGFVPYVKDAINHLTHSCQTFWNDIEAGELKGPVGSPVSLGDYAHRGSMNPDEQREHVRLALVAFLNKRLTLRLLNGRPKDPENMSPTDKTLDCEALGFFHITKKDEIINSEETFPAGPDPIKERPFMYRSKTVKRSNNALADEAFKLHPSVTIVCAKIRAIIDAQFDQPGGITTFLEATTILRCLGAESTRSKGVDGFIDALTQFSPALLAQWEIASPIIRDAGGVQTKIYYYSQMTEEKANKTDSEQRKWFNLSPVFTAANYGRYPLLKKTLLLPGSASSKVLTTVGSASPITAEELADIAILEVPIKKRSAPSVQHSYGSLISQMREALKKGDVKDTPFAFLQAGGASTESVADALARRKRERLEAASQAAASAATRGPAPAAKGPEAPEGATKAFDEWLAFVLMKSEVFKTVPQADYGLFRLKTGQRVGTFKQFLRAHGVELLAILEVAGDPNKVGEAQVALNMFGQTIPKVVNEVDVTVAMADMYVTILIGLFDIETS